MSHPQRTVIYSLLVWGAHAACLLLWHLARYGQNPAETLPTAQLVFLGALFAGLLYPLSKEMSAAQRGLSLALGLGATLLWSVVTNAWPGSAPTHIITPLVAVALAEGYRFFLRERAPLVAAMTVYTACTLLANYTLDSFIPVGGALLNVGTLFFGITFTQRDRVHRFGRRYAYLMIAIAAVANVVTALALETPLRYVWVSFLAIVISEVADTEVYQRFIHRRWLTRVAASNAVSAPLDTILFTVLAFYGEAWATPLWMARVITTDVALKFAVGLLAAVGIGKSAPEPAPRQKLV